MRPTKFRIEHRALRFRGLILFITVRKSLSIVSGTAHLLKRMKDNDGCRALCEVGCEVVFCAPRHPRPGGGRIAWTSILPS